MKRLRLRTRRGNGRVGLARRKALVSRSRRAPQQRILTVPSAIERGLRLAGRTMGELAEATDRQIDLAERWHDRLSHRFWELDNELRFRFVDGLLPRISLKFDGNTILSGGYRFKAAELFGIPESSLLMEQLHEAGCPGRRIDIAQIGSGKITEYTRWAEALVKRYGLAPDGWLERLTQRANEISRYHLSWHSFLSFPEELLPSDFRQKYVRDRVEDLPRDKSDHELGALELDPFGLYELVMGLFWPVSDLEPGELNRLLPRIWKGQDPINAITPATLLVYQVPKKGWYVQTGGGLYHRTLNIMDLGADESQTGLPHPMLQGKFFQIRSVDWLRRLLLPAVEEPGEQIRLATTVIGVIEHRRGDIRKFVADLSGDIWDRARKSLPKRLQEDPNRLAAAVADHTPKHELLGMLARDVAAYEIETNFGTKPYYQTVVVSIAGRSPSQVDDLYNRASDRLKTMQVHYQDPADPFTVLDNYLAMLPDVRMREVRKHTTPLPSLDAAASLFRSIGRPVLRRGAFVGSYTRYRDPLIIPLGGNYFFTGTTGSGKSMALKWWIWNLLPLSDKWVFRIMDNTDVAIDAIEKARGLKEMVWLYDGLVLFAGHKEFDDPDKFRRRLEQIWADGTRVVLFHSTAARAELDMIYLEWLSQDIQKTPHGMIAIDETADWFRSGGRNELAEYYVTKLLNQFRRHNKMSVTSIQGLGLVREAKPDVFEQLMDLIDGGKLAFYTPNIKNLPLNLGLDENLYPEVCLYVRETVGGFKAGDLGPLRKPGHAVLVTGVSSAEEVKFEVDLETLLFLSRKKPVTGEEEELWGL